MKELIDDIENSNGQDVTGHLTSLEQILSGDASECESQPVRAEVTTAASTEKLEAASASSALRESNPVDDSLQTVDKTSVSEEAVQEARREFLIESFDSLERIERDLLVLEKAPGSEEVLNSVFEVSTPSKVFGIPGLWQTREIDPLRRKPPGSGAFG